jgi:hypothetical protein
MDDNDPDSMLETEYSEEPSVSNTLPTDEKSEPKPEPEPESKPIIATERRSMLREEETEELDTGEEKTSIEQKSIYEDQTQKEHYFSKAKVEASSEFAEQMKKRQEFERDRRKRFLAAEKNAKKQGKGQVQRNGVPLSFTQFQELESKRILEDGRIAKVEDETAKLLNAQIAKNTAADLAAKKDDHDIKPAIITAIGMEIVLALLFIPNRIFIMPKAVAFAIDAIAIMLTALSIIVLTVTMNGVKDHKLTSKYTTLFVGATILPGAIIRMGIAFALAALLQFIPTAGGYIGFTFGVMIGGIIHYSYLGHYRARISEITSFIAAAACAFLMVIPSAIAGTASQPVDPEMKLGIAVYFIEIFIIVLADQMMLKIKEWRESK